MENPYLLELYNVCRRISSEFYLRDVSLAVRQGEVHAVVGRNASGKSTLFSVIMGLFPADSGEIRIGGKPVRIRDAKDAADSGILMVSQNQKMFDNLSVCENIFFGQELMISEKMRVISNGKMLKTAREVFAQMGVQIDPTVPCGTLTPGERQLMTIARAIVSNARILLLDEPSTHLNPNEKQVLYSAINSLKKQGKAFLLISHDLDEVLAVADEVSVMANGELIRTDPTSAFDRSALIEATYGIKVEDLYRRDPVELGKEALRLEGFSGAAFHEISFSLRHGELLVVLGDAQSGKLELVRALAGLRKTAAGRLYLNGAPLELPSPISAVRAGIALACTPEDEEQIKESEQIIDAGREDGKASRLLVSMRIFASDLGKTFAPYIGMKNRGEYMTGGNLQRELIERTLRKRAEVYLLCAPSAGVDIPARGRIYYEISKLLKNGAAVIVVTADPEEAFGLADRILVLKDGKAVLEGEKRALTRAQAEQFMES